MDKRLPRNVSEIVLQTLNKDIAHQLFDLTDAERNSSPLETRPPVQTLSYSFPSVKGASVIIKGEYVTAKINSITVPLVLWYGIPTRSGISMTVIVYLLEERRLSMKLLREESKRFVSWLEGVAGHPLLVGEPEIQGRAEADASPSSGNEEWESLRFEKRPPVQANRTANDPSKRVLRFVLIFGLAAVFVVFAKAAGLRGSRTDMKIYFLCFLGVLVGIVAVVVIFWKASWLLFVRSIAISLGLHPRSAADYVWMAKKSEHKMRWEEALDAYEKAIRLDLFDRESHQRRDSLLEDFPELLEIPCNPMPRHVSEQAMSVLSPESAKRLFDDAERAHGKTLEITRARYKSISSVNNARVTVVVEVTRHKRLKMSIEGMG